MRSPSLINVPQVLVHIIYFSSESTNQYLNAYLWVILNGDANTEAAPSKTVRAKEENIVRLKTDVRGEYSGRKLQSFIQIQDSL